MTLTAAQKQSYDDNGFLVVKGAFTTAELDRMERGVMRAVRAGNCIDEEKTYPAPATQYTVEGQYQDDPDLLFVAEHPTVIELVQALLGAPACLSAFISYLKTPGASGTGGDYQGSHSTGHCDYKTYQQAGSSLNWLFAIIALTDLDEETGPLLVSQGSHKASRIVPVNNQVNRVERGSATDIAPLTDTQLRRGDLVFMHMFTWHEGRSNRSNHDRFGLYNKYRARNAPPACGPQLFSERCYQAFSEPGKRLLPHHGDLPYAEARLIVDHQGKVLLVKCDDGSWQLPGASLSGDDPGSVTAKVMTELEAALTEQHGLVIPWMTYVSDYQTASGIRRVFAYQDDDGSSAGCVSGSCFRWSTTDDIRTLAENGELTREDADALRLWWDESFLRGIGETPERARGASRPAGL